MSTFKFTDDTEARYAAMKAFHPLVLEARLACEAQPYDDEAPMFDQKTAKIYGKDSEHYRLVCDYLKSRPNPFA